MHPLLPFPFFKTTRHDVIRHCCWHRTVRVYVNSLWKRFVYRQLACQWAFICLHVVNTLKGHWWENNEIMYCEVFFEKHIINNVTAFGQNRAAPWAWRSCDMKLPWTWQYWFINDTLGFWHENVIKMKKIVSRLLGRNFFTNNCYVCIRM